MSILDIFKSKAQKLTWRRLPDTQVVGGTTGKDIPKDEAYFVLRMKEMYVQHSRKLWRKYYPMLHGFTEHAGEEVHAVAGPGQLRELGEANLDRIVNLNYRLAGPTAVRADEVSVLVGLYSVPGEDAAKALIDTVGVLAGLGGIALGQAAPIANAVKTGVENILGLDQAQLAIGIRDIFYAENPLRSGYHVGINKPDGSVDLSRLWLKEGRLLEGSDPFVARPYDGADYMVLEIERRDSLDAWPSLPGMAEYQQQFGGIMADANLTVAQKRERLAAVWPQFTEFLASTVYLTRPDRERIATNVAADLNNRLAAMQSGNPFVETRSVDEAQARAKRAEEFDFVDVGEYEEPLVPAGGALGGNPFTG